MQRVVWVLIVLFAVPPALGLGLAQDHHENRTIELHPGQAYTHRIELQNTDGVDLQVNITLKNDNALIDGKSSVVVDLPKDRIRNYFEIQINVPKNLTSGERFTVPFSVQPLSMGNGQINMALRMNDQFHVLVVKQPGFMSRVTGAVTESAGHLKRLGGTAAIWVVALAALILFGGLVYRQGRIPAQILRERSGPQSPEELALQLDATPGSMCPSDVAAWIYSRTRDEGWAREALAARDNDELIRTLLSRNR